MPETLTFEEAVAPEKKQPESMSFEEAVAEPQIDTSQLDRVQVPESLERGPSTIAGGPPLSLPGSTAATRDVLEQAGEPLATLAHPFTSPIKEGFDLIRSPQAGTPPSGLESALAKSTLLGQVAPEKALETQRSIRDQMVGLGEFFTTPAGVATAGIGAGARALGGLAETIITKAISAGFAIDMLHSLVAKQAPALGENWDKMDSNQKWRAAVDTLGMAGMAGLLTKHAATGWGKSKPGKVPPVIFEPPASPVTPEQVRPPEPSAVALTPRVVEDYVEPEPTETVVKAEEFASAPKPAAPPESAPPAAPKGELVADPPIASLRPNEPKDHHPEGSPELISLLDKFGTRLDTPLNPYGQTQATLLDTGDTIHWDPAATPEQIADAINAKRKQTFESKKDPAQAFYEMLRLGKMSHEEALAEVRKYHPDWKGPTEEAPPAAPAPPAEPTPKAPAPVEPEGLDDRYVKTMLDSARRENPDLPPFFYEAHEKELRKLVADLPDHLKELAIKTNGRLVTETPGLGALNDTRDIFGYVASHIHEGEIDWGYSDKLGTVDEPIQVYLHDAFAGERDRGMTIDFPDGQKVILSEQELKDLLLDFRDSGAYKKVMEAAFENQMSRQEKASPPAAPPAAPNELRDLISANLSGGQKAAAIKKLADKAGISVKEMQERIEAEIVRMGHENSLAMQQAGPGNDGYNFRFAVKLYENQPTMSGRTSTSVEDQAYSTPLPLSVALNHALDVKPETAIYDPTGGNGMLLIGGDMSKSHGNEINKGRAEAMRKLGVGTVTEHDATKFTPGTKFPVVKANPPFGSIDNVNYGGYGIKRLEHLIALKALEAMDANGKGAIILGAKREAYEGMTENIRDSIERARRAINTIRERPPGPIDKKSFETAYQTMQVHGARLGLKIGKLGTYFSEAEYGKIASELDKAIRSKYETQTKGAQWVFENYLYGHYNVVGNFELAGDLYSKQGASWPVRVIVVDGKRDTPIGGVLAPESVDRLNSWEDVWKEADRIRNEIDRRRQALGPPGQPGLPVRPTPRPAAPGQPPAVPPPASPAPAPPVAGVQPGGKGTRQPQAPQQPGPGGPGRPPVRPLSKPEDEPPTPGKPGAPRKPAAPVEGGIRPGPQTPADATTGGAGGSPGVKPGVVPKPPAVAGTEHQDPYVPRSGGTPFGTLSPKGVVSGTHSALDALKQREGSIDEFVSNRLNMEPDELRGVMAGEQIDGVALAIDQIERGEAVIIGDETGIGKGRQGGAIIRYAKLNGKIPLFFTKDPKLFTDMHGDLKDINTSIKPLIFGEPGKASIVDAEGNVIHRSPGAAGQRSEMQRIRNEGWENSGYDSIFATYSQINNRNARQLFLEELAQDNDVIVILDEAHEAAGNAETSMQAAFMSGGTVVRGSGPDQVRITVPGLLKAPGTQPGRGGVLYMSATYAKRPDNMPVYFRTSLRHAADSFGQIVDAMKRGGVALQQAVSESLSKVGQYIRRERDFTGVSYSMKRVAPKDEGQLVDHVDQITDVLTQIVDFSQRMRDAVIGDETSTAQSEDAMAMTDFASIVHNQVGQLLLAAKADAVVEEAIAAKKAGEKPVIAVSNTMESFLDHFVEDEGISPGQPMKAGWPELLKHALERSLRTTTDNADGSTTIGRADPDAVGLGDLYRSILATADGIESKFPVSPIDYILQKLNAAGVKMVELTGRESGIQYSNFETGEGSYARFKKANKNSVVNQFNGGHADGMLLNASGSTGLSAHASEKFADQRPRHMIIGQPALDINTFVQTLGRIKRTGMVLKGIGPDGKPYGAKYTHLVLPLQAELRPAAIAAKKMKSLNANTTAESDNAIKIQAEDIMNKYGDRIVAEYLNEHPELEAATGIYIETNEGGGVEVPQDVARKLTGRMAIRPNSEQEAIYKEIIPDYNELVEQLKATGDYDLEVSVHHDWDGKLISSEELVAGTDESNLFTAGVRAQQWEVKDTRHVPTGAEMQQEFQRRTGGREKLHAQWADVQERIPRLIEQKRAELNRKIEEIRAAEGNTAGFEDMLNRLAIQEERWQDTSESVQHILRDAGDVVELNNTGTGETYDAMLVDAKMPTSGFRASPSNFKFRFAIDAPGGVLYLTARDFMGGLEGRWTKDRSYKDPSELTGKKPDSRYHRDIIVGNPIRAYAATGGVGKVVRFNAEDGSVVTGLMMPRSWHIGKLAQDPRMDLASPESAEYFLRQHGQGSYSRSGTPIDGGGGTVRIVKTRGAEDSYTISTPAARRTGGAVYLDEGLRDIVGDFTKVGNKMTAEVETGDLRAAIRRIMEITKGRLRPVGDSKDFIGQVAESNRRGQQPPPGPGTGAGPGSPSAGQGPDVGFGWAPPGAEDIYGIASRVRHQRALAGQVAPVESGEGVSPADTIQWGRDLLNQGVDPEKALRSFERDPSKKIAYDLIAVTRAHGEAMAKSASDIEIKFGTESAPYRLAQKALSDWDARTKAMDTQWHKIGQAMQGHTDIDTGTFTGLSRAYRDATGEYFSPGQAATAKKIAMGVSEADKAAADAAEKLKTGSALPPVEPSIRRLADKIISAMDKTANEALARIRARQQSGRAFSAGDPADLQDVVIYGAAKITKGVVEFGKWSAEMVADIGEGIKPYLKKIYDSALKYEDQETTRLAGGKPQQEKVRTVTRKPKATAKTVEDPADLFWDFEPGGKMTPAQVKALWDLAKEHISKGTEDKAEVVHKIASEVGIPAKDVLRGLSQNAEAKRLADDVWQKQRHARILKQSAKRWIANANETWAQKILPTAARLAFSAKTGLHGTVAMGTHAPLVVATHPVIFAENFGKMYKLVASPEYFEMQQAEMARRPNYTLAQRAGLVNDLSKMEDFNDPRLKLRFPKMSEWFRDKLDKVHLGRLVGMGTRGYSVLKILRQDLFDQEWGKIDTAALRDPEGKLTPEGRKLARAIATSVNHITGVTETKLPSAANYALFAPKLLYSRVQVIGGDPLRAVNSLLKLRDMSQADKWFATNQFKEKAKIFAVASSLLMANQTLNNLFGDKKKLNGVPVALGGGGWNPMASDFMKFRVAGMNVAWGSPFLTMMRMPLRIIQIGMGSGGKSRFLIYPDESMFKTVGSYLRTQESPFLAPVASLLTKADWQNRPLPQIPGYGKPPPVPKRLAAQGVKPYTWPEFALETVLPIPFQEGAKEVFHYMGVRDSDMADYMKAFTIIVTMGATGARVTEDWKK